MPDKHSWRDIPQHVKPRAMSSEGRRRVFMGTVRVTGAMAVAAAVAWGCWETAAMLRENPDLLPAVARADHIRSLALVTDGVLDKNWLAKTLDVAPDATLMGLDIEKLRARVLADPQVATAEILRNFPDRLTVRITERSPVVRMMAQAGADAPALVLVSRDGVVFGGRGYDAALIDTLPWLEGVTLARSGGRYLPVQGMKSVSELLSTARLEAEELYKTWSVISLNRLDTDGDIEVHTRTGLKVTFGTREDYLRQIARLDLLVDSATDPTRPIREVNLALGSQVPVKFGTAAAMLTEPPVNRTGPPADRPVIAFPSLSTIQIVKREL
ncbi:MAG TPA: FtsQ-type POTRA domain-containing protein [Opitutaceae bacterium]